MLLLAVLVPTVKAAADLPVIDLWPEGVPGLKPGLPAETIVNNSAAHVSHPTLTVYAAPEGTATGTAVIICPGGGYTHLSMENEGSLVAGWLNTLGVNAFVLKYRLGPECGQPAPLQDVLRAIRTVRSQAAGFKVSPQRVGVIGFSAGGHLASCAVTLYDNPAGRTGAALDTVSARPDFGLLIYPVITMDPTFAHLGSRTALLGRDPAPDLVTLYSTERQITAATPPCFLVHAEDDHTVPLENTLQFYLGLRKAGVSAELHVFEKGGHGFGMKPNLGQASTWPQRAADWMKAHGWLAKM
jgi:acetyl esterase/lipase